MRSPESPPTSAKTCQLLEATPSFCIPQAHGLRRLLTRPWSADTFLSDLLDTYVLQRGSLVQLVQHSAEFREWLGEFSQASASKKVASNFSTLRAAKHRFESYAAPLSRFILDLDSLICLATKIVQVRRSGSRERRCCEVVLSIIDEESVLQLAMMADCADECLCFYDTMIAGILIWQRQQRPIGFSWTELLCYS